MPCLPIKLIRRVLPAILLLAVALPAQALEAGAAKVRLTFPEGTSLGGDADRRGRPALGEHDPLWARCLYLNDSENHFFLVTLDMHHIPQEFRDRVVALAAALTGPENLVLTATHTGNGPGGMESRLALRWRDGRYQPTLLESTAEAVVKAMKAAQDGAQRATLGSGTARQQGLSVDAHDPAGPIDEQIGVIRVDNADGQAIAILTNFSAMPRMVPEAEYYHFSADYPGAYYTALESLSDPGCVAMFLPGACAGQRPANPENQSGWAEIESVGRLLAVRTKEVANSMTFRDLGIAPFYREVPLPQTVADAFCPPSTIVQGLVLDDLVLLFLPAMPSVEVGMALRKTLGDLGYARQFVVGASNDFVMDIVSRDAFSRGTPESARHQYGPGMADWLLAEVVALFEASESTPDTQATTDDTAPTETAGEPIMLRGAGYARGLQRGQRFAHEIRARYEAVVVEKVRAGHLVPPDDAWQRWPDLLDPTPLAIPALASAARPQLQGIEGDLLAELEGMAQGAGLPFDALWMLQTARAMQSGTDATTRYVPHLGTALAATGERAGAEGVLVGLNLDWPEPDAPVVAEIRPETGHRFIQIGFDWQMGAMAGVNDAGVTVALLELGMSGTDGVTGLPLDIALREVLQYADSFETALSRLQAVGQEREGRVLVSAQGEAGWQTAVLTLAAGAAPRTVDEGLLWGIEMSREGAGVATRDRYQLVAAQLEDERILSIEELQRALAPEGDPDGERRRAWNSETRFSAVLVPGALTLHVAFPDGRGGAESHQTFTLERGDR